MSIFKRGKHAKAEAPGSSYGSVSLSSESIEKIAESTRLYLAPVGTEAPATMGEVGGAGWTEVSDYVTSDGFNAQEFADGAEETLSFYQVAGSKPVSPFEEELDTVLGEIRALLLEKNASYGDSALNPVRIMSDADAIEQLKVRIDDKFSRMYRGFAYEDSETGSPEDTLKDIVGYYFLLKIAEARNAQS